MTSIIPVRHKIPVVPSWKEFQQRLPTQEEKDLWAVKYPGCDYALICGAVSGNLEAIDLDAKYYLGDDLLAEYMELIPAELYNRLAIQRTASGGYHILYRCAEIAGNKKLAQRPTTDEEKLQSPHERVKVVIETRGEGGYIVLYSFIQGSIDTIPTISSDERALLWQAAYSFHTVPPTEVKKESTEVRADHYIESPWAAYNRDGDVLSLLQDHGWQVVKYRDNNKGKSAILRRPGKDHGISGDVILEPNTGYGRWFSVFTTSSEFESLKAYSPSAVFCKLECGDNWKEAAKELLKKGYGEKYTQEKAHSANVTIETFWKIDTSKKKVSVNIDKDALLRWLHEQGFALFYHDSNTSSYRMVRVQSNIVSEAGPVDVLNAIKDYVDDLPDLFDGISRSDLMNAILDIRDLRTEGFYWLMPQLRNRKDLFLKDSNDIAFFPFRNGVAQVTPQGISLLPYSKIDRLLWKGQIIDHSIDIVEDQEDNPCVFDRFLGCVSGRKEPEESIASKAYIENLIGYLCHGYKDVTKAKAVVFAENSDDSVMGGGAGKGIAVEAISRLVNVVKMDGKTFDPEKSFAFQRVNLDTKIIAIDDTRKNFNIEGLNNPITGFITVEKKNQGEITIGYDDSPKFMVLTNYVVPAIAGFERRRLLQFEFSRYFNPDHTPIDHFGHRLFYDWDKTEWDAFYSYMMRCVMSYFGAELKGVEASNDYKHKAISLKYGEEFKEFFFNHMAFEVEGYQSDFYRKFLEYTGKGEKDFTSNLFGHALKYSIHTMGWAIESKKNSADGGKRKIRIVPTDSENIVKTSNISDEVPF